MTRNRELEAAYAAAVSEISAAFYRHDPDSMGISVGAPEDEYSDTAERILRECRDASTQREVLDHIRATFRNAQDELGHEVFEAILRFQQVDGVEPSN